MSLLSDLWEKGADKYRGASTLQQDAVNPFGATRDSVHAMGGTEQGAVQPDPVSLNPNARPPSNPRADQAHQKAGIGLDPEMHPPVAPAPSAPAANGTAGTPVPTNYDWTALASYLQQNRDQDLVNGLNFGKNFYGQGNPEMAAIMEQRRQRAMGLNGAEVQAMRERASQGINQEMATGLRQNRTAAAANGVRGGAAVGANAAVLARANDSRAGAERDIALADMQRRGQELNGYESSLTGERAGLLGTGLGFANLGAQDRTSAMQYGLGNDFMESYKAAAGATPNMDSGAWNASKALENWKAGGYKPGQDPIADWLRKNVYDVEGGFGIDPKKYTPQSVFMGNKQ